MKKDILLAGVGGQGILTIATIIGDAATMAGLHLKQAEVHGMSQRGGDVQSNLRLSTEPIYSDLIRQGAADLIISMEPMEALRYSQGAQSAQERQYGAARHVGPLHGYSHPRPAAREHSPRVCLEGRQGGGGQSQGL